ncbi:hypothetical protein KO527_00215 [Pseudoalteromonas sp. C2R02]|uniref:hypothetical protein n=1 Tax=Pseudoalteromonas sp. C2R02 TaxID=2841565 RepID=UPI001C09150A|nr:hypothetical protein [Pseudoalteromonas sp. C2R02]MBU2967787.1 hypothetical protein [Pseudoalteromonas sp. C2R02]
MQKFLIIALFITFSFSAYGNELISPSENWYYYDKVNAPNPLWYSAIETDELWQYGQAQLGYGEGDENTTTSYGEALDNKTITQYFRKQFKINKLEDITKSQIRLLADDGAAIYLNGQLIYTVHLPEKFDHSTLALNSNIEHAWIEFNVALKHLRQGDNVIAVSIHQLSPTSSDLSFDLSLIYQ